MRRTLELALALVVVDALSGSPTIAAPSVDPHGMKSEPHGAVGERLEAGSNSFSEAQVRKKFEEMGFGEVTDLRKDDQGIWRGKAVHAGKELSIGMDYKGNVAAE